MSQLRDPIDRVAKALNAGRAQHRACISVEVDDLTEILAAAIRQNALDEATSVELSSVLDHEQALRLARHHERSQFS